jgi:methylenetetrahydrofolate reductase (NADPH)
LHITCIAKSREEILEIINFFYHKGVRQFVAVRGDGEVLENGFKYALDLISSIRNNFFDVAIYAAGYPEKPEELKYLEDKISCGINGVITQICFDSSKISNFANSIRLPTLPGLILPSEKTCLFAQKLNIDFPQNIIDPLNFLKQQIESLKASGLRHFHFYTLNNIENLLTN